MLAKWVEFLPLFVVRMLATKMCERINIDREGQPRTYAIARPDVLIRLDK
jgi:hypothetical protein